MLAPAPGVSARSRMLSVEAPRSTVSAKSAQVVGTLEVMRRRSGAEPLIGVELVHVSEEWAKETDPDAGVAARATKPTVAAAMAMATAGRIRVRRCMRSPDRI